MNNIVDNSISEFCDYFICNHCGQRVERGIVNVVNHSQECPAAVAEKDKK